MGINPMNKITIIIRILFAVTLFQHALVEAVIHILGKKARKVVVFFFLLQVGFSSAMDQGGLSGLSA
jgi:hypothetical protein